MTKYDPNGGFIMKHIGRSAVFIGSFLLALICYAVILHMPYFADDYTFYFVKGSINPLSLLYSINPHEPTFFRPIEAAYKATVQYFFGMDTLLVHLANILLHGAIGYHIYDAMMRLRLGKGQALAAGALFVVAQAASGGVARSCTMAQLMSCLGSIWFLKALYFSEEDGWLERLKIGALFFLALISKETSLFLMFSAALLLLVRELQSGKRFWQSVGRAFIGSLPYIALTIAYLLIRMALGLSLTGTQSGASMQLGLGVVKNFLMLWVSAINPLPTALVYKALTLRQWGLLGAMAAGMLIIFLPALIGLIKSNQKPLIGVLLLLMAVSCFPAAAVGHVSDLYGYNLIPFVCMLMVIGYFALCDGQKFMMRMAVCALTLLIISNAASAQYNLYKMHRNADRTQALLSQLRPIVSELTDDDKLVMVDTQKSEQRYSYGLIYMTDVQMLRGGVLQSYLDPSRPIKLDYARKLPDELSDEDGSNPHLYTSIDGQIVRYQH